MSFYHSWRPNSTFQMLTITQIFPKHWLRTPTLKIQKLVVHIKRPSMWFFYKDYILNILDYNWLNSVQDQLMNHVRLLRKFFRRMNRQLQWTWCRLVKVQKKLLQGCSSWKPLYHPLRIQVLLRVHLHQPTSTVATAINRVLPTFVAHPNVIDAPGHPRTQILGRCDLQV